MRISLPGCTAYFSRHVLSWQTPRQLCNQFLSSSLNTVYLRQCALKPYTKRTCNDTRTCKYRLAVACNHLRRWPSRVDEHTCTIILLYHPISHLHKSFILHNSSCLFQSLMIIVREQHCMYNIHALCKIQYSCSCLLGVTSESQFM